MWQICAKAQIREGLNRMEIKHENFKTIYTAVPGVYCAVL